ncbi:RNA 2',3'-cyclic phosphodiesterase [Rhodovulum sp. DZ06]|uniref:RNA 2',3'-cyclic phosphodiesterase n=1 Tax=Rhodovulum sp. DZ06 TaxID=3425126 RepID=UPI003D33A635
MTIRAFVALPPPAALLGALEDLGHDLDCGRPVPEENLHVTLAFLGEHDRHVLEDVALELDRIRTPAPLIGFDGIGRFGSKRPTAAHALCTPNPELSALHDAVRRAAAAGGVALKRRKFIPHVTLARFPASHPADGDLERWSEEHAGFAAGPLPAPYFALYRSELTRGGPVYSEAMRFGFT